MKPDNNNGRKSASAYRIGIVGGGQLAKMTALAGHELGCEFVLLERKTPCPSEHLAIKTLIGDWDDPANLKKLAAEVDVVTLENEFVDATALADLEEAGFKLFPSAHTIGLVQDKFIQKQTLAEVGIAMPDFAAISSKEDILKTANEFGWPMVLKARRNGYDGKGNATLRSEADIDSAWVKLDGDHRELYLEAFCPFVSELAIMITRSQDGEMVTYPVVESVQKDHICHTVYAPASQNEAIRKKAELLAKKAVETIDHIGTIGVEMFLTEDGKVLLNEMAPRVHNSGHYTIEGCECSQFENHVRAIIGWPLGSTTMTAPAAVMINLLGVEEGTGYPTGIEKALDVKGAHVHSYGKLESRVGRKMGHVTALGENLEQADRTARAAADRIHYGATE